VLAIYFLVQAVVDWNAGGRDMADSQSLTESHTNGDIR
jgi:hypothetical protein